jgi:hypothetical protein
MRKLLATAVVTDDPAEQQRLIDEGDYSPEEFK